MEKLQYILAIDLGTGGPKVALVNDRGVIVDHDFEPNDVTLLPGGGAEQSPRQWWETIRTAAARVLGRAKIRTADVAAVCCTTQWSGTVAVDKNGEPLMDAIIWLDSRGAPHIKELVGGWPSFDGYALTKAAKWLRYTGGIPTHSGKDPVAHILYIQDEHPDIYEKTHKFLEPKDYLNLRLTGEFTATYDSIAIHWVTDNRDLAKVAYREDLLALTKMDRAKLPDLLRAVDVVGTLTESAAADLGLAAGTKVIGGTPDLQSAALGSGAVRDFEGNLYIGTSSWLTCHVPFKKVDILHSMTSLPSALPAKYLLINEQETAGECLDFLRDNIFAADDELKPGVAPGEVHGIFNTMAARIPAGSDRLIFTPWLYGERTPIEDATIRGGFHNMSLQTTRAHMVRAVMEGVAYNSRWLLGYAEKYAGRVFPSLNFIGGGAKSDLWSQILADVLGRPIRQVKDPILANVRGAGFLGCHALGFMSEDDISESIEIHATRDPDPANRAIYDELFAEYRNIYSGNKAIHARLNRRR